MRLILAAALFLLPAPAFAQVWTDPATAAEQNRLAMEQLRAQAEQRQSFARQQQIQTDLVRQRIERQRLDALAYDPSGLYRDDRDPAAAARYRSDEYALDTERLAAEAAARREDTARRLAEMDAWYATPPR